MSLRNKKEATEIREHTDELLEEYHALSGAWYCKGTNYLVWDGAIEYWMVNIAFLLLFIAVLVSVSAGKLNIEEDISWAVSWAISAISWWMLAYASARSHTIGKKSGESTRPDYIIRRFNAKNLRLMLVEENALEREVRNLRQLTEKGQKVFFEDASKNLAENFPGLQLWRIARPDERSSCPYYQECHRSIHECIHHRFGCIVLTNAAGEMCESFRDNLVGYQELTQYLTKESFKEKKFELRHKWDEAVKQDV